MRERRSNREAEQHHAGARRPANREQSGAQGVPEGWIVTTLSEVVRPSNTKTEPSASPDSRCLSLEHIEQDSGRILGCGTAKSPWVSSGEVRNNIIETTREHITEAGYKNASVGRLPRGTVLLGMIGEERTRGQSAILDIEATINQNIAALVVSHGLVVSEFLWRWFQMRYEATREQGGGGSGPQALNCQRVRELPFLLPPLTEQHKIARRVEALFALADKIKFRVALATQRLEKSTQAILAKAFRGELVPTEAELARQQNRDYEPATVLLERIRAERDNRPKTSNPSNRNDAARSRRKRSRCDDDHSRSFGQSHVGVQWPDHPVFHDACDRLHLVQTSLMRFHRLHHRIRRQIERHQCRFSHDRFVPIATIRTT